MINTDLGKISCTPKGEWSETSTYDVLDIVEYQHASYVAKTPVPMGTLPTNTGWWMKLVQDGDVGGYYKPESAGSEIRFVASRPDMPAVPNIAIPNGIKINDTTPSDTEVYSSEKIEKILTHPQYNNLVVLADLVAPPDTYQASKKASDIRNFANGGGTVELHATIEGVEQVYGYEGYDNGAVFRRPYIDSELAERITIRVLEDRSIAIEYDKFSATMLNIRTTNRTVNSPDLLTVTREQAKQYASELTPWNSTEIPASRIASMVVGCTARLEVNMDGTTVYIVGIVKEVATDSCEILGIDLVEPGINVTILDDSVINVFYDSSQKKYYADKSLSEFKELCNQNINVRLKYGKNVYTLEDEFSGTFFQIFLRGVYSKVFVKISYSLTNTPVNTGYECILSEEYFNNYLPPADAEMSATSTNAVQNKVVTEALGAKADKVYVDNTFAGAVKETLSGTAVATDMVSPVEHDVECRVESINLITTPYIDPSPNTMSGITYVVGADNKITTSGVATTFSSFTMAKIKLKPHKKYKLTGTPANAPNGEAYVVLSYVDSSGNTQYIGDYDGKGTIVEIDNETDVLVRAYIQVSPNTNADGLVFAPKLEKGSVATPYTPYVPDLTAAKVSRYGRNIFRVTENYPQIASGLTIEKLENGKLHVSGMPTENNSFFITRKKIKLPKGDYFLNDVPDGNPGITAYIIPGYKHNHFVVDEETEFNGIYFAVSASSAVHAFDFVYEPQLSLGAEKQEYEQYIMSQTLTPTPDGTVSGMTSLSPNMTILSDNAGVNIEATYNQDTNKVINKLMERIAVLEGTATNI